MSRCYYLLQTRPGLAGDIAAHARTLTAVAWADAITGSYDVIAQADGDRGELAGVAASLRQQIGVDRLLVCTPEEVPTVLFRLEEAREPVPQ